MIKINNMKDYAWEDTYVVARNCDGDLWFWGSWNDLAKAEEVAQEIGGMVVATEMVER